MVVDLVGSPRRNRELMLDLTRTGARSPLFFERCANSLDPPANWRSVPIRLTPWPTSRVRVAAHNLQTTSNERAFFALISPRVVMAPLPNLRARFIDRRLSREPIRALHRWIYDPAFITQ